MAATAAAPESMAGEPSVSIPLAKKAKQEERFSTSPEFVSMLCHTKAEQVRNKDNVIFVCTRDDKLVDVWTGLVRHGFLSCPVVGKNYDKYYGFVDMLDIVSFVVDTFGRASLETADDWWAMVREDERLQHRTVRDVMKSPLSFRNPFHPVFRGFSLFSAFEVLARVKGVHRVPVIDEQRRLYCVLTQSHLLRILQKNHDAGLVGDVMNKPIERLQRTAMKEVIVAKINEPAIDAFRRMVTEKITGLAVVDEKGAIVGALSARDVKAISTDGRMFYRLHLPLSDFLPKLDEPSRPKQPVTVKPDETVGIAVQRMVQHRIHRIFVEQDGKPVGVVSIKDALYEILEDPSHRGILIE